MLLYYSYYSFSLSSLMAHRLFGRYIKCMVLMIWVCTTCTLIYRYMCVYVYIYIYYISCIYAYTHFWYAFELNRRNMPFDSGSPKIKSDFHIHKIPHSAYIPVRWSIERNRKEPQTRLKTSTASRTHNMIASDIL